MNSKVLFQQIVSKIKTDESADKIQEIVYMLFENIWGISKTEVIAEKDISDSDESMQKLHKMVQRINQHEPVQYVVGEAYFFGRKFRVNPAVLIPRPETEDLIRVVLAYWDSRKNIMDTPLKVLDIGTGSGSIAITLSLEIQKAEVYAIDISNAALEVATHNAETFRTKINLIEHNIFRDKIPVQNLDVVVSNPPYVINKDMGKMGPKVVDYEPHLAIFVPDDDPLVFCKAIVRRSKEGLNHDGLLAIEINERFGKEVSQLFSEAGFRDVEIVKDFEDKVRVVRGLMV